MADIRDDLRRFYEQEADRRRDRGLRDVRVALRETFVDRLGPPLPPAVLEVGCGPGHDGIGFRAAGIAHVGVDLAFRHVELTCEAGSVATQASLFALPVRSGSFDAVWTMSTYMHVPTDEIDAALDELFRVVAPGGLVGIGTWGGNGREGELDDVEFDPPRFFSWRTRDHMDALLAARGTVEHLEIHDWGIEDEEYHFAIVRAP